MTIDCSSDQGMAYLLELLDLFISSDQYCKRLKRGDII